MVAPSVLGKDRQLGGHITGALNCGVSRKETVELMVQLIFYGGYPCTLNALATAENAFDKYDERRSGIKADSDVE